MDTQTGLVWITAEGVSKARFDSFETGEQWRKVGFAAGAMDQALFAHSPNATEIPVKEQTIQGLRFINVALPQPPSAYTQNGGLIEIMVNKAHVLGFAAGRTISILHINGQQFVEVVGDDQGDQGSGHFDGQAFGTHEGKRWHQSRRHSQLE